MLGKVRKGAKSEMEIGWLPEPNSAQSSTLLLRGRMMKGESVAGWFEGSGSQMDYEIIEDFWGFLGGESYLKLNNCCA